MAAVTTVTYADYYRVVTNDPHEGDPSAVYEDETPVPVGGIRPTPANIFTSVCGYSNPDAYLLFSRGGGRLGPLCARPPAGHNESASTPCSDLLEQGVVCHDVVVLRIRDGRDGRHDEGRERGKMPPLYLARTWIIKKSGDAEAWLLCAHWLLLLSAQPQLSEKMSISTALFFPSFSVSPRKRTS